MRKLYGFLTLFVLMVSSVFAATIVTITPGFVNMAPTDDLDVYACISDGAGTPAVGLDLDVTPWCKDNNNNGFCGGGDTFFPVEFTPTVTSSPTNVSGCGTVHLKTVSAPGGQYAYKVNGKDAGFEVASGTGIVLIPEFTTIGAGLALAGASFYMYRKRSKK